MIPRTLIVALLSAASLFLPAAATAQSATVTLSGTVLDPQDAFVADASVTASIQATGFERTTTTTDQGYFVLADLPPGRYRVLVVRSGFAAVEFSDVVLSVGEARTLPIRLSVAGVDERVSVSAAPPLLRESATVATVITRELIGNQPLNGRTFQSLIALSPGAVLTASDLTRPGQFSVNGQRTNTNYFTVDGVSANFGSSASVTPYESGGGVPAFSALGSTNSLASVDAVEEFSIQTSTYAAESGRQPGAQVSIVTRAGTTQLRGSVFDYYRDAALDANSFFANLNGLGKPDVRANDFGGVLGGPVPLFRNAEGEARTFFFASYEGLRITQPFVTNPLTVPSLTARANATGAIKDLLNAFPLPTGPALASDPTTAPYIGAFSNPSSLDATSVRIDHQASGRVRLFGRYNYAPSDKQDRALFCAASCVSLTESNTQTLTAGATMVLSPRMVNDLRVNYSASRTRLSYFIDGFGGAVAPPPSSLYPSFTSRDEGYFYMQVDEDGDNTISDGLFVNNRQRQFHIVDTVSWTAGAHALKAGVDLRRLLPITDSGSYRRQWNPNSIAALTQDRSNNAVIVAPEYDLRPTYLNVSAFVQDTWRATGRLTLTYGLRYDINPAPGEANGHLPYAVTGLDTPGSLVLSRPGSRLYDTDYTAVAPRFGVTFVPLADRGLLLRGGFGVFYDLGTSFLGNAFSTSLYPVARMVNLGEVSLTSPALAVQPPPVSGNPPYPRLFGYQDDYRLPYSLQYSFGIEQALRGTDAVSVAYVGSTGRRLGRVTSLRNPSPEFTRVDAVTNDATSDYDSLQLQYRRRLSGGLMGLVSYTLAKATDIVSDESSSNFQSPADRRVSLEQDRGPASFDVRHSLSAAVSYDIPVGGMSGLTRALLSDFGFDGILRARSALPVNVLSGRDPFGFRVTTIARPDLVPGVPLYLEGDAIPGGRQFNPAAFDAVTPVAEGRQGTLGRNALRGFSTWQIDLSVRRRVPLAGRSLLLRLDAFNFTNRTNFANPSGIMSDANFGRATQILSAGTGGLSQLFQVGSPRSIQLSARVQF